MFYAKTESKEQKYLQEAIYSSYAVEK